VTLSCLPPPVSSAVILTQAAGGNEAAAVFNSAFGSVLGIFVTPLLLFQLVTCRKTTIVYPIVNAFLFMQTGVSTAVSASSILSQLSLTVLLPLIVGQLVRRVLEQREKQRQHHRHRRLRFLLSRLSVLSRLALLLIIFTTFCDAFKRENDGGGGQEGQDRHQLVRVIVFGKLMRSVFANICAIGIRQP
jgi:sodium/bile acid cotransporter 7